MIRKFHFFLVAIVLFAAVAGAPAEQCAVCGQEITGDTVYMFTDKVTNEKKHVCFNCSILTDECFVCGMPVKKDFVRLSDGRVLCARDAKNAVLDPVEAKHACEDVRDQMDRLFSRFTGFPTNVDFAIVDRVNLIALFKVPGNDYDCPDVLGYFCSKTNHGNVRYDISVMSALSPAELRSTCAHELSHAWVAQNVSAKRRETLGGDAEEGFCELMSYLLMDSENEESEKKVILANTYTRGQIDLFIAAERVYGINDVLDWMKWGRDAELEADTPEIIRAVDMPPVKHFPGTNFFVYAAAPTPVPDTLVLKGISGVKNHALAVINDQSLAVGESEKVRVGKTNILVRCLEIRDDSVRVQIGAAAEERVLSLKKQE
jgi:hypothetical protein